MGFFVYLVECRDKTLYCGFTTDVEARLSAHNKGLASKYTRPRRPVKLAYLEAKKSKGEALKREAEIKSLSRSQKLALVRNYKLRQRV